MGKNKKPLGKLRAVWIINPKSRIKEDKKIEKGDCINCEFFGDPEVCLECESIGIYD